MNCNLWTSLQSFHLMSFLPAFYRRKIPKRGALARGLSLSRYAGIPACLLPHGAAAVDTGRLTKSAVIPR